MIFCDNNSRTIGRLLLSIFYYTLNVSRLYKYLVTLQFINQMGQCFFRDVSYDYGNKVMVLVYSEKNLANSIVFKYSIGR